MKITKQQLKEMIREAILEEEFDKQANPGDEFIEAAVEHMLDAADHYPIERWTLGSLIDDMRSGEEISFEKSISDADLRRFFAQAKEMAMETWLEDERNDEIRGQCNPGIDEAYGFDSGPEADMFDRGIGKVADTVGGAVGGIAKGAKKFGGALSRLFGGKKKEPASAAAPARSEEERAKELAQRRLAKKPDLAQADDDEFEKTWRREKVKNMKSPELPADRFEKSRRDPMVAPPRAAPIGGSKMSQQPEVPAMTPEVKPPAAAQPTASTVFNRPVAPPAAQTRLNVQRKPERVQTGFNALREAAKGEFSVERLQRLAKIIKE